MNITTFSGSDIATKRIIYTPSSFSKNNLIYLQEVGELQAKKHHTGTRENLNSYLFFIVTEGSGTIQYHNEKYKLKSGDCVFIDCNKYYSHTATNDLWSLKWVHFYGNNLSEIYDKYIEQGGKNILSSNKFAKYENIIDNIFTIANSYEYTKDMKIYEHLVALLSQLMQENFKPENKITKLQKNKDIYRIKQYIDNNYTTKISLDNLSDQFFINKFYLSRLFKATFGISIINYILKLRITKAKELLRYSSLSIEEISAECGIEDPNYFSRIFKNIEGITPNQYRSKW